MTKEYLIIENKIVVGVFQNQSDRDEAFAVYILNKDRFAIKGER